MRLLIIEDNEMDVELIRQLLRRAEDEMPEIVSAESLADGIAKLKQSSFDLILLDLGLPGSRGEETIREAETTIFKYPTVILTGLDDQRLGVQAVRKGAQDYLVKGEITTWGLRRSFAYALERVKLKEELRTINRDLERKVRERTALAEDRAHRLRQLASAITLAEQKERRRLAQILHDHLQQILVAARIGLNQIKTLSREESLRPSLKQMEDLLDDAVSVSRSFTVELSPPILRDAGLVAALHWLARWFHEKYQCTVHVEAESELKDISDEIKIFLFQAVRELLLNVIKHAGKDEARIEFFMKEAHLCLRVSDEGAGFQPEILSQSGSEGFGIFSIRERLEMLGGGMEIDSAPGKGTRCLLSVPTVEPQKSVEKQEIKAAEKQKKEAVEVETPSNGFIRVLVVDDHKLLRQGLINMLNNNQDIRVIGEAGDGEEAVQKVERLKPDLVLMDVSMPRMNGVEATRIIRDRFPDVHVIGLSLHDTSDMAERMTEAGASAYFTKTGPIDELVHVIREHH